LVVQSTCRAERELAESLEITGQRGGDFTSRVHHNPLSIFRQVSVSGFSLFPENISSAPVIVFAIETGMRGAEILKPRWCDVDLANGFGPIFAAGSRHGGPRGLRPLSGDRQKSRWRWRRRIAIT
jgi:hypothetical protein